MELVFERFNENKKKEQLHSKVERNSLVAGNIIKNGDIENDDYDNKVKVYIKNMYNVKSNYNK